jgi:hypothetical protein
MKNITGNQIIEHFKFRFDMLKIIICDVILIFTIVKIMTMFGTIFNEDVLRIIHKDLMGDFYLGLIICLNCLIYGIKYKGTNSQTTIAISIIPLKLVMLYDFMKLYSLSSDYSFETAIIMIVFMIKLVPFVSCCFTLFLETKTPFDMFMFHYIYFCLRILFQTILNNYMHDRLFHFYSLNNMALYTFMLSATAVYIYDVKNYTDNCSKLQEYTINTFCFVAVSSILIFFFTELSSMHQYTTAFFENISSLSIDIDGKCLNLNFAIIATFMSDKIFIISLILAIMKDLTYSACDKFKDKFKQFKNTTFEINET